MSAGWADSLAAGLGAAIAGEDLDDVVGAVAESALLNLIPLYAIGSVVAALAGPIKELLGVEKDPPILGLLLDSQATAPVGRTVALQRVRHAAGLRAFGFQRYQDVRRIVTKALPTREVLSEVRTLGAGPEWTWRWILELQDALADAFQARGADGILELFRTSALHLQAFHAVVALQAWAETSAVIVPYRHNGAARWVDAGFIEGAPPTSGLVHLFQEQEPIDFPRYAHAAHHEVAVRLGDFRDEVFAGAERKPLKGKWGLFKRLGLPSYQQYEAAILANAGPQHAPVDEVFPGAADMNVEPIEGFEDASAAPEGETAPAVAAAGAGSSPLAATAPTKSKPKAQSKAAPKSPELPVAVGIGGLAILLALL